MKRFIQKVLIMTLVPLFILLVTYVYLDPFKTLKHFDLDYVQDVNREYVSTELYLYNNPKVKYDSYIFGSSVASALNIEHWEKYLPVESTPFLFQAWSETLTGIEQKISFIDALNQPIKNVIVVLDFPNSFTNAQLPKTPIEIKHYKLSNQPYFLYQLYLYSFFLKKPSFWIESLKNRCKRTPNLAFDKITNNWESSRYDINIIPKKDSLRGLSEFAKNIFFERNSTHANSNTEKKRESVISATSKESLNKIMDVFVKHNTNFKILLSPFYDYGNNYRVISQYDLHCLEQIFGKENIYNYTGENEITKDYNMFMDPNHMGARAAWIILEDMYNL